MNRISQAFAERGKVFAAFITGGDPDIDTTVRLILALAEAGADLIEIGIPFSDPVAEGPVIQRASARALANGCTIARLFTMVEGLRAQVSLPLVFMTYLNPILAYGKESFLARCAEVGIDGLIIPDLPFEEHCELSELCRSHGVSQISMIAPTSAARIEAIAAAAEGFLYCVSSLGVTGTREAITTDVKSMIDQVRAVSPIPCLIGFGIATPDQAHHFATLADGIIIGSAIVQLIETHAQASPTPVANFAQTITQALRTPDPARRRALLAAMARNNQESGMLALTLMPDEE